MLLAGCAEDTGNDKADSFSTERCAVTEAYNDTDQLDQFLENYFHAGWDAIYEVQILDDNNNIVEPSIETNINIEERGYFINDQIQWNNTNEGNKAYYYVKLKNILH